MATALFAGVLATVGGVGAPSAEAAESNGTIVSPTEAAVLSSTVVELSGTAETSDAIDWVRIAVQDLTTREWLRADGSRGATYHRFEPALTNATETSADWSHTADFGAEGVYRLFLIVREVGKPAPPVADRATVVFSVVSVTGEIAEPLDGSIVEVPSAALRGTAASTNGVGSVALAVQNLANANWLQPDKTWAPTYAVVEAETTPVSPTEVAWALDVRLSGANGYSAEVGVSDATGAVTESHDVVTFTYELPQIVDAKKPRTQVRWPFGDQLLTSPNQIFQGTASDDNNIVSIEIGIRQVSTGKWLHATDGTLGRGRVDFTPSMVERVPSLISWSLPVTLPEPGTYRWASKVTDAKGKVDHRNYQFEYRDTPADGPPAFLTLLISRAQWMIHCRSTPGAKTLEDVANALDSRGLVASMSIVKERVAETTRLCDSNLQASWQDIEMLRDDFGWSTAVHHKGVAMTRLSYDAQVRVSCGDLQVLQDRGYEESWGLFAYGANRSSDAVQADPVGSCFAFGRRYGAGTNTRTTMQAPWFADVASINGGYCNDVASDCFDTAFAHDPHRYQMPDEIAARMRSGADSWTIIQMYRFVEGARLSGWGTLYDCTDPDPAKHWTGRSEVYCWNDFLAALDTIDPDTVVTNAATVAEAWGRGNPGGSTIPPVIDPGQVFETDVATAVDAVVGTVVATDNVGVATMSIVDGDPGALFEIDDAGVLTVAGELVVGDYILTIEAGDVMASTSTETIVITVS